MPGPGEVVTVAVQRPITARDLTNRRDVAAEIDAGRVVRVQCAVMSDGWWDSLAVLPEGWRPTDDRALTLVVSDPGSNDRLAVNRIVGRVPPPLGPGGGPTAQSRTGASAGCVRTSRNSPRPAGPARPT